MSLENKAFLPWVGYLAAVHRGSRALKVLGLSVAKDQACFVPWTDMTYENLVMHKL